MGPTYAEIEIINRDDIVLATKRIILSDEVKHLTVTGVVDTSSSKLAISQRVKDQLNLSVLSTCKAQMENGEVADFEVVGPVEVKFMGRMSTCRAIVLPGIESVRFGRMAMDDMDVVADHDSQKLIVNPVPRRFVHVKIK